MSHKWEYEDEYFQLMDDMKCAKLVGDAVLYEKLQVRMAELDAIRWRSKIAGFPELTPYTSVVEALQQTATKLGLPFPDLSDSRNHTGDGHFLFGVSDGLRTVQIWPMEDRGYYDVDLFDYANDPDGCCYTGHTTSLDQATLALSRWFVERCPIGSLHAQCPWIALEPLRLSESRMTLE